MRIWAIDQEIEEAQIELRSLQDSKAALHAALRHAWADGLDAGTVAGLLAQARECEARERHLARRLERMQARRAVTELRRDAAQPKAPIAA